MPGFNGNGPVGKGAMTGKGFGVCIADNDMGRRRGGFGQGYGTGCRNGFGARKAGAGVGQMRGGMAAGRQWGQNRFDSGVDEAAALEAEARQLQQSMEQIQQRLDELKQKG